jgi:hypothetical protein
MSLAEESNPPAGSSKNGTAATGSAGRFPDGVTSEAP